jgi:hypothetical protein
VFFSDAQKRDSHKICPCVSRAQGVITVDTALRPDAGRFHDANVLCFPDQVA